MYTLGKDTEKFDPGYLDHGVRRLVAIVSDAPDLNARIEKRIFIAYEATVEQATM